jgi:MSHA biogenesis protein MshJ
VHFFSLGPMFAKQDLLRSQIVQQQNNIAGIDGEISPRCRRRGRSGRAGARASPPCARNPSRLPPSLRAMQNGLVPPERMAPLVEAILRANGRLKLVSVRTLPVEPLLRRAKPAGAPARDHAADLQPDLQPPSRPRPAVSATASN